MSITMAPWKPKDLFEIALDARTEYALMHINKAVGDKQSMRQHRDNAVKLAWLAGRMENQPMPSLLGDVPVLAQAWRQGVRHRRGEERERQLRAERESHKASVEESIRVGDWACLGLPHPDELFNRLSRGQRSTVCGHVLSPDEHGVWITNPYGQDCGLWQNLPSADLVGFLSAMAHGKDYGPVPPGC